MPRPVLTHGRQWVAAVGTWPWNRMLDAIIMGVLKSENVETLKD